MAKLTKAEVVKAVYRRIYDAEGYDSDELATMRTQALDYYYNRDSAAPSAVGRCSIQSSDVADMLEAVLAQMMPCFELDNICEFTATREEDIEQARIETAAVTYTVMQANNGYYEIQQAVRDALLLRNGIIKVYLDETVKTDVQNMVNLTELEFGQLKLGASEDLSGVDKGYTVEVIDEGSGFYDVRVTTKNTVRLVKAQAVDPVCFMWERNHDSIYLQDADFVAERSYPTRSDLLKRGYKKSLVQALKAGGDQVSFQSISRNQSESASNWQGDTPADDIIEFFEVYMRIDIDGDGMSELWKLCVADKTILDMVEMDYIPYASGTAFLQPHRFNGLGLFDKLRNIQDGKTVVMRQLLDNQNHANNARIGVVDGAVNLDDATNSRPGGLVRIRSADALVPFPFTDIGPSAQNTLAYLDKVRSERGGASLDLQSAEMQIAGDTAHGVERQMSAKEQLAAMMTRTLAETLIRSLWQMVHFALRLYMPDDMQVPQGGQFVTVDPSQWPERRSVTVMAGLSNSERMRKKQALEVIIGRQDILQSQGKYVAENDIYNAQLDWARAQGMNNPERYFTDPSSQEAMQYQQQRQQEAQAQQLYQAQLLAMQQEIENRKANNEDAKVFEDARQFDDELKFKYWAEAKSAEVEEAKMASTMAMSMIEEKEPESASRAN
jgi:hypothetical protein